MPRSGGLLLRRVLPTINSALRVFFSQAKIVCHGHPSFFYSDKVFIALLSNLLPAPLRSTWSVQNEQRVGKGILRNSLYHTGLFVLKP